MRKTSASNSFNANCFMDTLTRRNVLTVLAGLGLLPLAGPALADGKESADLNGLQLKDPHPFSFDRLVEAARRSAAKPYVPDVVRGHDILEKIDFDAHWKIKYRAERTLDLNGGKAPIRFFHLGKYFQLPVGIHVVEGDTARQLVYHRNLFEMPADSPARKLPDDIGFAGFRVLDPDAETDWLAFLGAAYFRSCGELGQYGMSARAVAIDVAEPTPEEFPRFTDFYLAPSETGRLIIYCPMESPRLSGVLKMDVAKDGPVVMDIETRLFAREDMAKVGLAPLTSMFWYSETDRGRRIDWRPEVHDSDGLAMWTGAGERLWRPLSNPDVVKTSTFFDTGPKGFGLLQRDRDFKDYEDDGVFYDKRPSLWVEPKGDWGAGGVQLVEIPTDDEIHDNIAAYWVSKTPVKKGDAIAVDYRLTWAKDEPHPAVNIGHVVATRLGRGGIPGQPRPKGVIKVVVDFDGGPVAKLDDEAKGVEAIVSASDADIGEVDCYSVKVGTAWRATFDVTCHGTTPAELRLYLRKGDETLTETWIYQLLPLASSQGA